MAQAATSGRRSRNVRRSTAGRFQAGSILIKDPNAPEVFLFETEDGLIRHVRSPEAMDLFSLAWEKIQFVPGAVIRHLRRGVDITNGSLLGFALTGLPFPEEQLKTVGEMLRQ